MCMVTIIIQINRSPGAVDPTKSERACASAQKDGKEPAINVVDFPSSDFLANTDSDPKSVSSQRPATVGCVSLGTVFSMAPGVAAQMILEREMVSSDNYTQNYGQHINVVQHVISLLERGLSKQEEASIVQTLSTDVENPICFSAQPPSRHYTC